MLVRIESYSCCQRLNGMHLAFTIQILNSDLTWHSIPEGEAVLGLEQECRMDERPTRFAHPFISPGTGGTPRGPSHPAPGPRGEGPWEATCRIDVFARRPSASRRVRFAADPPGTSGTGRTRMCRRPDPDLARRAQARQGRRHAGCRWSSTLTALCCRARASPS